jgi:hypothetical protein
MHWAKHEISLIQIQYLTKYIGVLLEKKNAKYAFWQ